MTEDDRKLVELMERLKDPYGLHQVSSHAAMLCAEAAARITELSEQVEAKDARIAALEKQRDESILNEQHMERVKNHHSARALAAEATLAKSQAEVERLWKGADLLGLLLGADPGPKYAAAAKDARAWWHTYDARTALQETSDDQ